MEFTIFVKALRRKIVPKPQRFLRKHCSASITHIAHKTAVNKPKIDLVTAFVSPSAHIFLR